MEEANQVFLYACKKLEFDHLNALQSQTRVKGTAELSKEKKEL